MKKLLLIALCFPLITLAQKKVKGYGFIGTGAHLIAQAKTPINIAGRLNLGVMPTGNVGMGADLQFIQHYGTALLGEIRFIGSNPNGGGATFAFKAGTNFYNKLQVKGGLVYGAEIGVIMGKISNGFYVSFQYLSLAYVSKFGDSKLNDVGLTVGVKF